MSTRSVPLVIVGAGIAGLAAARRAGELGIEFILLEATDRIGGRIHTVTRIDGSVWDRGASLLRQPPINPLVKEAELRSCVSRKPWRANCGVFVNGDWLAELRADEIWHQIDECEDLARALATSEEDASILDLVDPEYADADLLASVLRHSYGQESEQISAADISNIGPFEGAWPVDGGFGTLIQEMYAEIPVELKSPVRVIDWGSDLVRVDLGTGLIEANRILITLSTAVLAEGDIVIVPDLPMTVTNAITGLPTGSINRVSFDINNLGDESDSTFYSIRNGESVVFVTPPAGQPGIVGIVAGQLSRDLEQSGNDEMIRLVVEHAVSTFGSDSKPNLDDAEATAWGLDPYIRGAASIALPHSAGSRAILSRPVADKLFFAGEALSRKSFGTVHGALQTGIEAVNRIAHAIGLVPELPSDGDNPDVFAFDF